MEFYGPKIASILHRFIRNLLSYAHNSPLIYDEIQSISLCLLPHYYGLFKHNLDTFSLSSVLVIYTKQNSKCQSSIMRTFQFSLHLCVNFSLQLMFVVLL
jgi:hypothetical protein